MINIKTLGFIMLRHVNSQETNKYWIDSYTSIRKYYPENDILIIDDNSNNKYITPTILYKTTIIHSEYHKRGELLPYYYYLRNKLFDIAVIIHDSVFINKYIDFNVDTYKMLWDFEHNWDQLEDEKIMINSFNDKELTDFYNNKKLWKGCFGGMSVITHDYLVSINNKYNLDNLLELIKCRYNRCSFERVIAVLLSINNNQLSVFGDIHKYCHRGKIKYNQKKIYNHLPVIKVWTGR